MSGDRSPRTNESAGSQSGQTEEPAVENKNQNMANRFGFSMVADLLSTTLLCEINTKSQSAKVLTWAYLSIRPPKCPSDYADLRCIKLKERDGSEFPDKKHRISLARIA